MKLLTVIAGIATVLPSSLACDDCYGPINHVEHVRHVKRIQPGAPDAAYGPTRSLEWGQLNFMQTTDTHGWLAGHLKEQNYGADWGDFVSFTRRMKHMAGNLGVDMLLIDTGDLHDGTGLADTTTPDGEKVLPVFNEIDYDLLAIGNHELYVADVAYQTFNQFAKTWGDKYLTSNVKILNPATGAFEYVGKTYRYFTTEKGLRIMAFGVLYDFTGASNVTQVIKAADMVNEPWFKDVLQFDQPIDLFLLIGHNVARRTSSTSTFGVVWDAIRVAYPTTPIQVFGGHFHIRDFAVYDESSTGLAAGRYCETVGWASMSGFSSSNSGFTGVKNPRGVANPTRKATVTSTSPFVYSRRYLDWNRYTFMYHSIDAQDASKFDYHSGTRVSDDITELRTKLNLGKVYGCVPEFYCMSCVPFTNPTNIFPAVILPAVATIVVNPAREENARIIIGNTGAIRFDLYKGPFTYDDNFIVSPFRDVFLYIPDVPYALAKDVLAKLNVGPIAKRQSEASSDFSSMPLPLDECVDPILGRLSDLKLSREVHGVTRRQIVVTPGYTTTDDFGKDGDDTAHSNIPNFPLPGYFEARAGFGATEPTTVDLVFFDFIESLVISALGSGFTPDMVECYVDCNFSSQDFMLPYAKVAWQVGVPSCPL